MDVDDTEPNPWLVLFWGAPAAGKSTVANRFIEHCHSKGHSVGHLGTDRLNSMAFGSQFDGQVRDGLYEGLFTMVEQFLRVGKCLVVEGTFLHAEQHRRLNELCQSHSVPLTSVCLQCPLPVRLLRNRRRPVDERVPEDWLRQAHGKAEKLDVGGLRLDTHQLSAQSAVEKVLELRPLACS